MLSAYTPGALSAHPAYMFSAYTRHPPSARRTRTSGAYVQRIRSAHTPGARL